MAQDITTILWRRAGDPQYAWRLYSRADDAAEAMQIVGELRQLGHDAQLAPRRPERTDP